jgi:hypothetical protein
MLDKLFAVIIAEAGLPLSLGYFRIYYIIMMLGGWESLDMVLRYTRSVKFEESLRVMRRMY